jgi:hypothetical protein
VGGYRFAQKTRQNKNLQPRSDSIGPEKTLVNFDRSTGYRSALPVALRELLLMMRDFEWPKAEQEADEELLRHIRERGCHILTGGGDKDNPPYAFSVGLSLNYSQAEIIVFGMAPLLAARAIDTVCSRATFGKKFIDGDISSDVIRGSKVCFVDVPPEVYEKYLGAALWFYQNWPEPFPCLQLVWSDGEGRFPWEAGFDEALKKDQPILRAVS